MALKRASPDTLPDDEFAAGVVLLDPLLFRLFFFEDALEQAPSFEQILMFCDESQRVILCTGRKIAKTIHLEAIVLQYGLTIWVRGILEAMFCTPGEAHMIPFMDRVLSRIDSTPLFKMAMRTTRRAENPIIEFWGGARWYLRIEGLSNTDVNMVGLRAMMIVCDEMAFGNWPCHNSRLQSALPSCKVMYSGVPNGIRSTPFYAIDQQQEGKGWSHHKYSTFINPLYRNPAIRQQLIEDYGGAESHGYVTQVLGLWGTEMVSSFPPGSIAVNERAVYHLKTIIGTAIQDSSMIPLVVGIPSVRVNKFALGWDYGFSPDPSVVWGGYCLEDEKDWQMYFRLTMRRVAGPHQYAIVKHLVNTVFQGKFIGCMTDNVQAVQGIQALDPPNLMQYIWANPPGTTEVYINNNTESQITDLATDPMAILVKMRNKEFYAGLLKKWLLYAAQGLEGMHLWIGHDTTVTEEWTQISERKTEHGYTLFEFPVDPESKRRPLDHNFEAAIYFCAAVEAGLKVNRGSENEAALLAALGPVQDGRQNWKPPYGSAT